MTTCPRCSVENPNDAQFCSACGAATTPTAPTAAPTPPNRPYSLLAGVVAGGLAVGIGIAWLLFADTNASTDTAAVDASSVVATTVEATSTTDDVVPSVEPTVPAVTTTIESTTSASVVVEIVPLGEPYTFADIALEGGLFCRDVAAAGRSYAEAVRYWYREGAPDRMDADLNGVPCETVYDAGAIADFWTVPHPELAVETVALEMFWCDYQVTHVLSTEAYPDGTFDVKVRVDVDGDGLPDQTGLFNVYVGFDVFPTGDLDVDSSVSNGLYECRY